MGNPNFPDGGGEHHNACDTFDLNEKIIGEQKDDPVPLLNHCETDNPSAAQGSVPESLKLIGGLRVQL